MLKLVAVLLTLFCSSKLCATTPIDTKMAELHLYGLNRVPNTPAYECSMGKYTPYETGYYKFSNEYNTHIVKPSLCVKKYYTESQATQYVAYEFALFKTDHVRKSDDRMQMYFQCGKPVRKVSKYYHLTRTTCKCIDLIG